MTAMMHPSMFYLYLVQLWVVAGRCMAVEVHEGHFQWVALLCVHGRLNGSGCDAPWHCDAALT